MDKIACSAPYIGFVPADSSFNFVIIVEKQILTKIKSFFCAIQCLISAYFTFDIQYPNYFKSTLLMLQHFVLGIQDGQSMPPAVTRLMSSMDKL